MKQLLIMLLPLAITLGASAQKIGGGFRGGTFRGDGASYFRPRVTVVAGSAYPYYGYGNGFGYSPFYNPYGYRRIQTPPTRLALEIEDLKSDYSYQIANVRRDKSVPRKERREKIRELKHQKDGAIIDAQKSYYNGRESNRTSQQPY